MNNSKLQPDKAILAVNTFVQDCQHENAVVRALALRTMLCIRVDNVTDYTTEPLRKGLSDSDPYVRKTAALGVLKLYAQKPQDVADQGFIEILKSLLMDTSPMVVSNSIIALAEIQQLSAANAPLLGLEVDLNTGLLNKLLNALPECTEWGQIVILDYIATNYQVSQPRDVELLLDRILPRLSHQNHSIVLSSIRILIKFLEYVSDEVKVNYYKKLSPPIVTLLGANQPPEIQYVVLRNILIIIQKYPTLLAKDVMTFFCKFNDPSYVKMEKLTILLKLLNEKNAASILTELKEYTTEVDVEFVRRVVKAIGYCALKVESAADQAIDILMECIKAKTEQQRLINDCVIVMKDILRKYPGRFEGVIGTICENLDIIDSPDAKISLIWIIGEYAEKISGPMELVQLFIENFSEEAPTVQMQILVATIKIFLKFPTANEAALQQVLRLCTEETDNPDLRDRAYFYWRLLSNDRMVNKLNDIVLGTKPSLVSNEHSLPRPLLEELLCCLNTLAATYHKSPAAFQSNKSFTTADEEEDEDEEEEGDVIALDVDPEPAIPAPAAQQSQPQPTPPTKAATDLDDILGFTSSSPQAFPQIVKSQIDDFLATPVQNQQQLLDGTRSNGLILHGGFHRSGRDLFLTLNFKNASTVPMLGFILQINKNCFGLTNSAPLDMPNPFLPGTSHRVQLLLSNKAEKAPLAQIQIAVKNSQGIYYCSIEFPAVLVFVPEGSLIGKDFIQKWKSIPDANERRFNIQMINPTPASIESVLKTHNLFLVTKRSTDTQENIYFSGLSFGEEWVLLEIAILHRTKECTCSCKTQEVALVEPLQNTLNSVLR
eukprot:TRINITY_DN1952_c0_g1_i1.p1 TRINITY_DN1952_c0_g1~~TRINITY_DN1952_c0_g1_i1.p1  ORF type:complete len:927 (+),score=154.34 TRINITY_DN1952_c0_g1_i1:292-2781(+)